MTSFMCSKGCSASLMKPNIQRRRSKAACKEAKAAEARKSEVEEAKARRIEQLERLLALAEGEAESNSNAAGILRDMVDQGVLDQKVDGTVELNADSPFIQSVANTPNSSKFKE
jgi:hypothetical protein